MNDEIPDVSSTGINDSAKMVWQAIRAIESFRRHGTVGRYQGSPGTYWFGSVNQVVNDLWPALADRYLTDKEQAELIKLTLNRFLKYNKVVVCTQAGGRVKPSLWFIGEHWPELTVTPGTRQQDDTPIISDEAATASPTTVGTSGVTPLDVFNLRRPSLPPPPPVPADNITVTTDVVARVEEKKEAMTTDTTPVFREPVTDEDDDDVVEHACRFDGCDRTFRGLHWLATHEMKHGFRFNADGTTTIFDVNAPSPDEEDIQELLITVCKGQEPMTQSQIVEAVRKINPMASAPMVKIVLSVLTDDGWFEKSVEKMADNPKTHTRRLKFLGEPVRKAGKKKSITEAVDETVTMLTEKPKIDLTAGVMATAVAALNGSIDPDRLARYEELFNDLLADLREIERLKAHIERLEGENAGLRQQLDEAQAKTDHSEDLARVTAERDELQGKLNTLKQIFN